MRFTWSQISQIRCEYQAQSGWPFLGGTYILNFAKFLAGNAFRKLTNQGHVREVDTSAALWTSADTD